MAKNISKNQWIKNIADDVYIETAVINNILFITATIYKNMKAETKIGELREPEKFKQTKPSDKIDNYAGLQLKVINGQLLLASDNYGNGNLSPFTWLTLKSKQLETDFYTPEQLAEMYPDDPAYQVATADLPEGDNPTLNKVDLPEDDITTLTNTDSSTITKKKDRQ